MHMMTSNIFLYDQNGFLLESDVSLENENIGNPYAAIKYLNNTNQPKTVRILELDYQHQYQFIPITFRILISYGGGGKHWAEK